MGRLTGSDAKKLYELYDSIYEKKKDCVDKDKKGMHNCAKKVCHEEYGEGETIFSQHAAPDENGFVSHYNVQFEHGIVENVSVEDLEVLTMVEHSEHVEHDGEVVAEDAEEVEEGAANILRAGLAAGTALAGGVLAKKASDVAGKIKEKQQKKSDMIKKTLGNSHELEGENLQEYDVQGAVKGALDKGAKFMKTNPVGKAVGAVLKPVGKGAGTVTKAQQDAKIKMNNKEEMTRITGFDVANLMEAYSAVYAPQELTEEQVWEEVEVWVNSLIEEGYDLSEYTWEDMYEAYIEEQGGRLPGPARRAAQQAAREAQNVKRAQAPTLPTKPTRGGSFRYQPVAADKGRGGDAAYRAGGGDAAAKSGLTRQQIQQKGMTATRAASVTSTGVSGLSAADRAAYSAGGGNAKAMQGMGQSTAQVIAQGKANLARMDQGKPAPAGARPTSGPSSTNPKSGLSAFPAARPAAAAAPAARPATPAATPAAARPASTTSTPTPQKNFNPLMQKTFGYQTGQQPTKPSGPKEPNVTVMKSGRLATALSGPMKRVKEEYDDYDVVLYHLLDEGYAETEEAALAIMANMTEEWRNEIVEQSSTRSMAHQVTDALPWNRNTKYTTQGKLRKPGENVHGQQTGRKPAPTSSMTSDGKPR